MDILKEMRDWAKEAEVIDIYCLGTNYGTLAFFRDQIESASTDPELETLLNERIAVVRAEYEARKPS